MLIWKDNLGYNWEQNIKDEEDLIPTRMYHKPNFWRTKHGKEKHRAQAAIKELKRNPIQDMTRERRTEPAAREENMEIAIGELFHK